MARELGVIGLMNVQFAVKGHDIYVLEVNPRASRTVPYVSKATGQPLAKIAARVMAGRTLAELGAREIKTLHTAVKEAVFPFVKFPGVDVILGPEMRSTGEVMGIAQDFASAFAKAEIAAGTKLPAKGCAFISVRDTDKPAAVEVAQKLASAGFTLLATSGTADVIERAGLAVRRVNKVKQGRPHCVDAMLSGDVQLVVNTTFGAAEMKDSYSLRRTALVRDIPYFTTLAAARAAAQAIAALGANGVGVRSLQEYNEWTRKSR
jgi:carbamoyl-phosphate synthase large subunit